MFKLKSLAELIKNLSIRFPNRTYNFSKAIYLGGHDKLELICPENHSYWQTPNAILHGQNCPECFKETKEKFIAKAIKIHLDKYDYSKVIYVNSRIKVIIICKTCGKEFIQRPANHLMGAGCRNCHNKKRSQEMSLTQEQFEEKANKIHNYEYDYSESKYKKNRSKIKIKCKKCGHVFYQIAANHLAGHKCPECRLQSLSKELIIPFEIMVEKANIIHKDIKYFYDKNDYTSMNTEMKMVCENGHVFYMTPTRHINQNQGCVICRKEIWRKKQEQKFIERSKTNYFPLVFDYSTVDYQGNKKKVTLTCQEGHEFRQTPDSHSRLAGCPICNSFLTESANERCCAEKLQILIPQYKIVRNDRELLKGMGQRGGNLEIDIIIRTMDNKDICYIEWNGIHWHSLPNVMANDIIKKSFLKNDLLVVVDDSAFSEEYVEKAISERIIPFLKNFGIIS